MNLLLILVAVIAAIIGAWYLLGFVLWAYVVKRNMLQGTKDPISNVKTVEKTDE